jgi:hypothetical protein
VSRCQAPAVWPPRVTAARPVRGPPGAGDPRQAQRLATPAGSPPRETASALKAPEEGIKSARTSAGLPALWTVPEHTGSRGQQRSALSESQRGHTTGYRPSLAMGLWRHRQVGACAFRTPPRVPPCAAAWSGRGRCRRAAGGRLGRGTSPFRLASDEHLGCAAPSVGFLHRFLRG